MSPAVQQFYSTFTESYLNSPERIAIFVGFLTLLVVTLLAYHRMDRRRYEKHRRQIAADIFKSRISEIALSPGDLAAVDVLAGYLPDPNEKYLIVTNENVFTNCARKARDDEVLPASTTSALRVRLGFTRSADRAPVSTAHLPVGAPVYVRTAAGPQKCRVEKHLDTSIVVRAERGVMSLRTGQRVELFYHNSSGLFRVKTYVQGLDARTISLAHSEDLTQYQKRRYFRKTVEIPVEIRCAERDDVFHETRTVDLGGGGASIMNPNGRFKAEDRVELSFMSGALERLSVVARVLRTSRNDSVIHVEFVSIREAVRDKIFNVLFRPQQ